MRARLAIAFVLVWPCAAENAVFDRQGRVSAMIYCGDELSVRTNLRAPLQGWTRLAGLEQSERIGVSRGQGAATWKGRFEVGTGQSAQFRQTVTEKAGQTELVIELTAEADLEVEGIFYSIDVPRAEFLRGRAELGKGVSARLPENKPPGRDFLSGEASEVIFLNAAGNLKLTAALDRRRPVFFQDKWERSGRAYSAWIEMQRGRLATSVRTPRIMQVSLRFRF